MRSERQSDVTRVGHFGDTFPVLRSTSARRVCVIGLCLGVSWLPETGAQQAIDREPALTFTHLPVSARRPLEEAYERAKASPRDAARAGELAMRLHAHEQLASARTWYGTAQMLERRTMAWPYLTAVTHAAEGDPAAAIPFFRRALEIDPAYAPARLGLADALRQAGDPAASAEQYMVLVRTFPELAAAHYGLGQVASKSGDPGAAAAHYERALELAPQFGAAHYAIALVYRDLGKADLARAHIERHRQWGTRRPVPADPVLGRVAALKLSARDLLADAAAAAADGRVDASIVQHLAVIKTDPDAAAQAHVNLVALYGRTGDHQKAEAHYRAALALGSSLADAHYNYGVLLAADKRDREALEAFARALEVNPFHAQAHYNLGSLLARQRRFDEAASHFRQALANDPAHRGARFNLARTLSALGRPREAIAQLERLLGTNDDDLPRVALALATAWWAAGDVEKALAFGEQARSAATARGDHELAAAADALLQKIRRPRR
jgi:tetratricopeptide (TPR) repeat protein